MVIVSKVAIVKGDNRKENIAKVLNLIEDDIENAIKRKKSDTLFIKINTIDDKYPLACTHPEALEAVVEYFYDKFERIIAGDNSYVFSQKVKHPYIHLKEKFKKIEFSDLTEFGSKKFNFKKINGKTGEVCLSLLPDKAFTVSLALPKTHDSVVFTACSKNMLGCVIEGRPLVHGTGLFNRFFLDSISKSISVAHENLATLLKNVKSDLAILDGFVGMEGEGPVVGSEIKLGVALASIDCIALDALAAKIAGFDSVPYLTIHSGKKLDSIVDKIEIIKYGFENLEYISVKFKPHHLYKYQILEKNSKMPMVDLRFLFSVLRRPHRIVAKVAEKIIGKS